MPAPEWMSKHPCEGCDTGYGNCMQFALVGLKCCPECKHPGRWEPEPWTVDDLIEMWSGKEDRMPESVRRKIADDPRFRPGAQQ